MGPGSTDAAFGSCGACGKTVRIGAVLYSADARILCPFCYTRADIAARQRAAFPGWGAALAGALAAAIPPIAHAVAMLMIRSEAAAGGASGRNWIALGAGLVAAACGVATVVAARSRARGGWLAIGALIAALGAYHLAQGLR